MPAQGEISDIDQLFSWITPETPGCAVAVAQNGEVVVNRAYGLANLEHAIPITPSTVFDIGSVQKQFVAAAQVRQPLACTHHGNAYPLGTVLRFFLPTPKPHYFYMRCELKVAPWPEGARPQWVIYSSNPS